MLRYGSQNYTSIHGLKIMDELDNVTNFIG